jgi:hypothetical protein
MAGAVWTNQEGTNILTRTFPKKETTTTPAATTSSSSSSSSSSNSSSSSSSSSCVIATHAVQSGQFTPQIKREAVLWCMKALHGKWWGEAIRRGYRYCGNKKIAQGKASNHYGEFRQYIDFASGKRRTLSSALTFTLRTAQFFVIGLLFRNI